MITSSCRIYDAPTINNQTGMPSAWCTDGKEYVLIDTVLGTRSQLFGRWTPIQQSSHPPTLTDVHDKEYTMSPRAIISTVVLSIDLLALQSNKMRLSWNPPAITQSKITMAGDTLYAKEYSTIICRTSLIRRQLPTGNNHHNLSNDSTNYATVLIATNLKLKDLRRCHHSGLAPPTTNRRKYQPQSHVPKMQIECQLTRASHSAPNALLYNSIHRNTLLWQLLSCTITNYF